jgi:AraC family transcriptional regulator
MELHSAPVAFPVCVEKYSTVTGECIESSTDRHVIWLLTSSIARGERQSACGAFVPFAKTRGVITIVPTGPVPRIRLNTPSELIRCSFHADFTRKIREELDRRPIDSPTFSSGLQDRSISAILKLLLAESTSARFSGALYFESLACALICRFLHLDSSHGFYAPRVSQLPWRTLIKVKEIIEANLSSNITLESLSLESGYSQSHFLRMFRASVGLTPHQYLLERRIRRAQELLRDGNNSLIDIAARCGFASQTHMTGIFRKKLGATPGEYRRTL